MFGIIKENGTACGSAFFKAWEQRYIHKKALIKTRTFGIISVH
jgi:hypothetical protein